jgi:hypothetical protein
MKNLLSLIALTGLASVAGAQVTEYADRASFEAALSGTTLLDFEGLGNQVDLGPSVDFGDLNIANGGHVYAIDDGGFGAPSGQVGDQNNQDTVLTLQPGYKALGMDMGLLFGAGSINITLRNEFGDIVASGPRSVSDNDVLGLPGSTFYGWISESGDLASLQLDQGGFPTVDNVLFARSTRSCYPDFTGDGLLDLFDFLEFVNQFNAGDDNANCDQEGGLDLFDFLCYTNAFNAGC